MMHVCRGNSGPANPSRSNQAGWQANSNASLDCRTTREASHSEFSLTVRPPAGEGLPESLRRLAAALKELDASAIKLMVFGSTTVHDEAMEVLRRTFRRVDFPVTWVDGAACDHRLISGIQVFAVSGCAVQRILRHGQVVGSVYEDGAARHCFLGGIGPARTSLSPAGQTQQALEAMQESLEQAGFSFPDVVRTWFFLRDILSWYDDFNRVRTEFYRRANLRAESLPASTGIGGWNPCGAALAAGAWAVQPLDTSLRVRPVASPHQCPAPVYGSSFSRAIELASRRGKRLLISGTASIGPGGETLWKEEVRRQIGLTMEVVEAILRARGFGMADITRATAYFKNPADAPAFAEYLAARQLQSLPVLSARGDICREDLLFELEADAWTPEVAAGEKSFDYLI